MKRCYLFSYCFADRSTGRPGFGSIRFYLNEITEENFDKCENEMRDKYISQDFVIISVSDIGPATEVNNEN